MSLRAFLRRDPPLGRQEAAAAAFREVASARPFEVAAGRAGMADGYPMIQSRRIGWLDAYYGLRDADRAADRSQHQARPIAHVTCTVPGDHMSVSFAAWYVCTLNGW